MAHLEDWSVTDTIYFTMTTFTFTGFGDLVPASGAGKIVTSLYLVLAILTHSAISVIVGAIVLKVWLPHRTLQHELATL